MHFSIYYSLPLTPNHDTTNLFQIVFLFISFAPISCSDCSFSNQITFELSLGAHTGVNRLFLFHVSFFQSAIQNLFTLLSVIRQKSTAKMDSALLFTHRKLFGKIGKNCRKTKIDQQNNPHKNYKEIVSKAHSTMMRIESCV